ncbi:hypothetical protein Q1M64_16525 [Sinorhizobium meliloti]|nr:hypothetical protein Q1M63_17990 [Sinorhizobium meliloti]WKL41396.1 hypothetical protein Q1M64_16525 [Sinorhizobium meliloti]
MTILLKLHLLLSTSVKLLPLIGYPEFSGGLIAFRLRKPVTVTLRETRFFLGKCPENGCLKLRRIDVTIHSPKRAKMRQIDRQDAP